jgi:hypothetical protein
MHGRKIAAWMIGSLALGVAAVAQQPAQPNPYQGVSQPPNDPITTSQDAPMPTAKPRAGVVATPELAPQQMQAAPQPSSSGPVSDYGASAAYPAAYPAQGSSQQALSARPELADPDGDIVHPLPPRPGELMEGVTIRVRLTERLSSTESEKGEPFHGQVASDVLQNGRVLIPAGSGIEGRVTAVSAGHFGGHGSFRLKPEAVILPDGSRYQLHAETTGTPGSKTRIGAEGSINPGSRLKKDGIEYGAVVGTGAVAGAVIGGPVGALTGSLVGAGIVTTHLMVDHPQATLEPGSILLFSLTEPMNLMPATN